MTSEFRDSVEQTIATDHPPAEGEASLRARGREWLSTVQSIWPRIRGEIDLKRLALTGSELLIVFLWGIVFTRPYLDLDPTVVPMGREYLSAIQTHDLWLRAQGCGWCALWDGSTRGGSPAFVDLHGSMLHPLVIVTTLLWGVVNGSKLALAGAFLMAGLGQWWLGKVLGVGRIARVWAACMAIVGGHLAGRMELGAFGVVLSTAAITLVFPALITVAKTGRRRSAVVLGVTLALAIVAGQGYMQFGLLCTLPAVFLLLSPDEPDFALKIRRFAGATCLAVLIAGPFLVPFLHFLPELGKHTDSGFSGAQPFSYVPLNLVIKDDLFFQSEALQKLPFPHLSVNFIGWTAVLLAMWGVFKGWEKGNRRTALYLAATAVLAMWVASAEPLVWLTEKLPLQAWAERLTGIRHPLQIAGLAVPPLLGLAALGLDQLLKMDWPQVQFSFTNSDNSGRGYTFDLRWLLAIPLLFALSEARAFTSQWIYTEHVNKNSYDVLNTLQTPDLQWVNPPFGEHFWVVAAREMGLKMSSGIQTWYWEDRPFPEPVREANRSGPPTGMSEKVAVVDEISIYAAPAGREYATVTYPDGSRTVCTAHGRGGMIEVSCDLPETGVLIVKENHWRGWQAALNGRSIPLNSGRWLAVDLPAGNHTIAFHYHPWDVPLGIFFCLLGLGSAVYYWRLPERSDENAMECCEQIVNVQE